MSGRATNRTGTTPEQRAAADPAASAWVSASAGSGKTYVLTRRVLRLLRNGVPPGRILCLTFTRAAAAEMTERVFAALGEWAVMDDAALAAALAELDGAGPGPADLARARRLFATALETPGGLKIQTIHAFAERVLHRFPFEANVAAHFAVLDDIEAQALREAALAAVLTRAGAAPEAALGAALDRVAAYAGDARFGELIAKVIDRHEAFRGWIVAHDDLDGALKSLAAALGADPGTTPEALRETICASPHLPPSDWAGIIDILRQGSSNDGKQADRLAVALAAGGEARADACLALFFTGRGKARDHVLTKPMQKKHPDLAGRLAREQARLERLVGRIRAQDCFAASGALFTMADAVIDRYEAGKRARGLLDYDDLIAKTVNLLTRRGAAQWVLYKLDGGIDHILIDEAQDTNPRQWEIIRLLAEEGLSGDDGRADTRSLFAVGDEKQSIYSFQGADPDKFDEMRRYFERRTRAAGKPWTTAQLNVSFRSGPAVLEAVDRVFAAPAARAGLSAGSVPIAHTPQRADAPGLVELWPVETADEAPEPDPWDTPLDRVDTEGPQARLARRIADTIAGWLAAGEVLEARGTPVNAGDILVLVRRRNAFVDLLVGALRDREVPVAGADRLVVEEHIAVMDLLCAADVALLPEDDLALATLLRSPLVGLGEDELLALAAGRGGTLMDALAARRGEPAYCAAHDFVARIRRTADYAPPFAFFAGLLGAMGGRGRLLARLGPEAADALNEFLESALDYEHAAVPSLQGFVHAARARRAEIKRNMDQAKGEVRIMTVHGAKGLEAPIVFLPDTCEVPDGRHDGPLIALGDHTSAAPLAWAVGPKEAQPEALTAAREELRATQMAEYRRLLYVAMTRARDRLYVCGARGRGEVPESTWYKLVAGALLPVMEAMEGGQGEPRAWRLVRGKKRAESRRTAAVVRAVAIPAWARRSAPPTPPQGRRLIPSEAGAHGSVEAGEMDAPDGPGPRRRGVLIHALIERLPDIAPDERAAAAGRLLAALAPDLEAAARTAAASEALALLDEPALAPLFGPGSRAEVALGGNLSLPGGGEPLDVSGQIDRLAVTSDTVLIADYKTGQSVPDNAAATPQAYLAQLAAYRAALRPVFPDKAVRAFIVWTAGPVVHELPGALLDAAEARLLAPRETAAEGAGAP